MINQGSQTNGMGVSETAFATLPTIQFAFLNIEMVPLVESWWKGLILSILIGPRRTKMPQKMQNGWGGILHNFVQHHSVQSHFS